MSNPGIPPTPVCPAPSAAAGCAAPVTKPSTPSPNPDFKIKYCKFIAAATTTPTPATATRPASTRINGDGGKVKIIVDNPDGDTFTWELLSSNLVFVNSSGAQLVGNKQQGSEVIVRALNLPGEAKVAVTRDSNGNKQHATLNVIKITFSESDLNKYGFDDLKPPSGGAESKTLPADKKPCPHVSIESDMETHVRVKIEGGAVGTDFDFMPNDASVFELPDPPPATADFDLKLKAKKIPKPNKKETLLRIRCKGIGVNNDSRHTCLDENNKDIKGAEFARLWVHVYKMKVVDVVVAKVQDSANPASTLPSPHDTNDYSTAGLNADANGKLKGAVLKYNIENHTSPIVNVSSLANSSGAVVYEIGVRGNGPAMQAINNAIPKDGNKVRVVLVKQLKSIYKLTQATAAGATQITVSAESVLTGPGALKFGSEYVRFKSATPAAGGGTKVDIEVVNPDGTPKLYPAGHASAGQPVQLPAHAVGDEIEFSAAGWGSEPVIIAVDGASPDTVKATILHEVGHKIPPVPNSMLLDVTDAEPETNATSIMHYRLGGKANRLRYLPRLLRYDNPAANLEENQWEKIERS